MPFLADDFRFMGIDMFHLKLELWQYVFPVVSCMFDKNWQIATYRN